MILISSAAYVGEDLTVEVGRIPPAFLPIGNKRLYEYQVELLSNYDSDIYLSLPESFKVPQHDLCILHDCNVTIIRVPDGLTLGNSLVFSWSSTGRAFDEFTILHGDTLFLNQSNYDLDCLSIHPNEGAYQRAQVFFGAVNHEHYSTQFVESGSHVVSGLFRFSKPQKLIQGIVQNQGDFIKGLQVYADEIGLNDVQDGEWLDFGHLNSFFNSRSAITTQRSFNNLKMDPRRVTKSSHDLAKMQAESHWFKNLPRALLLHTPALLSEFSVEHDRGSYTLEYLYLLPLNDLMVFGRLSNDSWRVIIEAAGDIIKEFSNYTSSSVCYESLDALYLEKTRTRIESITDWAFLRNIDDEKSYDSASLILLAEEASKLIDPVSAEHVALVHGDFCFSNILYDSRTQSLKLIDPRGLTATGELSLYGDRRYDVAKFFHSIIAGYDYIIAGRYSLNGNKIHFHDSEKLGVMIEQFKSVFCNNFGFCFEEIVAINVHLFLSMIPLHSDRPDRQKAMLINAVRLFDEYLEDIL